MTHKFPFEATDFLRMLDIYCLRAEIKSLTTACVMCNDETPRFVRRLARNLPRPLLFACLDFTSIGLASYPPRFFHFACHCNSPSSVSSSTSAAERKKFTPSWRNTGKLLLHTSDHALITFSYPKLLNHTPSSKKGV